MIFIISKRLVVRFYPDPEQNSSFSTNLGTPSNYHDNHETTTDMLSTSDNNLIGAIVGCVIASFFVFVMTASIIIIKRKKEASIKTSKNLASG